VPATSVAGIALASSSGLPAYSPVSSFLSRGEPFSSSPAFFLPKGGRLKKYRRQSTSPIPTSTQPMAMPTIAPIGKELLDRELVEVELIDGIVIICSLAPC